MFKIQFLLRGIWQFTDVILYNLARISRLTTAIMNNKNKHKLTFNVLITL